MKQLIKFFKQVFASVLGTTIVTFFFLFISFTTVSHYIKQKFLPKTTVLQDNTLLKITLEGCIVEHVMELPTTYQRISLTEMKAILEEAAYNHSIKGIYIELGNIYGGIDKLESLRRLFAKFKQESGKPVIICSVDYSDTTLAFASVADERIMRPGGTLFLKGFCFNLG